MPGVKRASEILQMTADEVRIVEYDWSDNNDLATGETFSSIAVPTVSPVGSLAAINQAVSGTAATVTVQGGTDYQDYTVNVIVTTNTGQKLEGEILVKVRP